MDRSNQTSSISKAWLYILLACLGLISSRSSQDMSHTTYLTYLQLVKGKGEKYLRDKYPINEVKPCSRSMNQYRVRVVSDNQSYEELLDQWSADIHIKTISKEEGRMTGTNVNKSITQPIRKNK